MTRVENLPARMSWPRHAGRQFAAQARRAVAGVGVLAWWTQSDANHGRLPSALRQPARA